MREKQNLEPSENPEAGKEDFENELKGIMDIWFDPKDFETRELYERFGISISGRDVLQKIKNEAFQKLRETIYGSLKGRKDRLNDVEFRSKIFEAAHLVAFGLTTYLIAENFATPEAILLMIPNLVGNIYPVLIQRYKRLRIKEIKSEIKSREEKPLV